MLSSIRRIARPAAAHAKTAVRTMAGGHSHGPHISPLHTTLAKGFLVVTFLWIFYRAKQDGAVLLVRRMLVDGAVLLVLDLGRYSGSDCGDKRKRLMMVW